MNILELANVSRCFDVSSDVKAGLTNVNLTIAPGERISILGHNGVGKSTLGRIIGGLDTQYTGECRRANLAANVPIIFQDYRSSLLPWLSAVENVAFPLALLGLSKEERRARAEELIQRLPISIDPKARANTLSGGQAQAVALLRAISVPSSLMVADEPFSALDHEARMGGLKLLKDHSIASNVAVVMISHSIEEAQLFSDRVVVLGGKPGRLIGDFPVSDTSALNSDWLARADAVEFRENVRRLIFS
jgi:NitT/TauT family transport system ATP-binding protein